MTTQTKEEILYEAHKDIQGQGFKEPRIKLAMDIWADIKCKEVQSDTVKEIKVNKLLGGMMEADMQLYERILDTTGFAFYFNELIQMATKK